VVVADGRRGVVVKVDAGAPERPVVRIGWDEGGCEVTPYEEVIAAKSLSPVDAAAPVPA
jgi:hypothetical protein